MIARVEFFGDEIDRIKRFDVLTGNAIESLEYVTIWPATHFMTNKEKLKENEESQEFEKVSIGEPIIIQKVEIEEGGITVVYGDVNCDGIVNNDDVDYLLKHLANWQGYELTEQGRLNADVNLDEKVDSIDALIILRHLENIVGYETLPYTK